MLKVLLVDDEPFISQGLSVLIDWTEEGYEIVHTASNGREAFSYLEENKVDLIIADIQMPEMNGLELLAKIRETSVSDAHFVILSGYSDFGYAKQAIQNGCTDYMLKPVAKEELLAVLRKVAHDSEHLRLDEQKQKRMERAYLEQNLLALLVGKYDEANLEYVKEHMRLSEGVRYVDIIYSGLNEEDVQDEATQRKMYTELFQACREQLGTDEAHAIFDASQDEKIYDAGFVYCDYMSERDGVCEKQYLENLRVALERTVGKELCMLIGKKVTAISGISKSYSTVRIMKSLEAFHEKRSLYFYEDEVQVGQNGIVLCKQSLDALIAAIEENESVKIHECVERLYEEFKNLGVAGDVVNLNINYLLFQLIHLATEQDDEVNQEEILHFVSESSFEEGVMRGSSRHLARFACEYAEYLGQLRKNVSRGVLDDIEREIRENYAENLRLRDLGKKYYVNSSYLGQIFRKKYGQSFSDYLTNYRMNEATKLLLKTDKKVNQIAEAVGYKDSDYFIRKFIELKGCTPSKFRKTQSENDSN